MECKKSITDLRVVDSMLQYSTDCGCTWTTLGAIGGEDGKDGADGKDGTDGCTPEIDSETKHWCCGGQDTGICAEGKDGVTPYINQDGYWVVNGQVTQYNAAGDTYDVVPQAGTDIAVPGTPTVTRTKDDVNKVINLIFNHLKGEKGDTPEFTVEETEDGYDLYVDEEFLCSINHGAKGETGETGATGPQGPAGLGIKFKADAASCVDPNDGYVDADGYLYVRYSATGTAAAFYNYGCLRGPQGPRGPQGMWYIRDSFETISGSTSVNFDIDGAYVGDYVVFSGTSTTSVKNCDVFQLDTIVGNVQYWKATGLNIRGPKGDLSDLSTADIDLDTLVMLLRGYPLYSQGDGIDIVPNSEGYYTIKALIDNSTIKFDDEGRLTATGGGGGYGSATVVRFRNTESTEGLKISEITKKFLGIDLSLDEVKAYDISHIEMSEELARNILDGKVKSVVFRVPGDKTPIGNSDFIEYIPCNIIIDTDDYNSCFIMGQGYKAQHAKVVNSSTTTVTQSVDTAAYGSGLSPVLYCMNILYDEVQEDYIFYGFEIYPYGNFGLFGDASADGDFN